MERKKTYILDLNTRLSLNCLHESQLIKTGITKSDLFFIFQSVRMCLPLVPRLRTNTDVSPVMQTLHNAHSSLFKSSGVILHDVILIVGGVFIFVIF